jgi:hypothetical protein
VCGCERRERHDQIDTGWLGLWVEAGKRGVVGKAH